MFNFLNNISPKEIVVLIVIVLIIIVFFGSRAVTGLAKTGGETLKELKNIKKGFKEAIEDDEPKKNEKGVSKT